MSKLNPASKKYLQQIKKELRYDFFPSKKMLLSVLSDDLLSFEGDDLNGDYHQICNHFGQPDKFAENILDSIDAETLKVGRRTKRILLCTVILSLVILLGVIIFKWYEIATTKVVHTTESTVVYVDE